MIKIRGAMLWMAVLGTSLLLSPSRAAGQDPVKVAPEVYKATIDNEQVRVLDVHLKPGGKSAMHSHPGYVAIALTPCKVKFTSPDGKSQVAEFKAGEASWRDAETHGAENVGKSECHVTNVEIKAGAAGK